MDNKKIMFYKNMKFYIPLIIFIIIGVVLFIFKIYNNNLNFAFKINKDKISKEEFILYLYDQKKYFEETGGPDIWETPFDSISAKEVAKNNAISSLILVKTVSSKAKELNITLTEEEEVLVKQQAKELKQEVSNVYSSYKISLKDCEKYIRENIIELKIFSHLTNSYQINEDEFEKYYNKIKLNIEESSKKIILDYINVPKSQQYNSQQIIQEIFYNINQDTNFRKFDIQENVFVETNVVLEDGLFEPYLYDIIYKLNEGSTSNIIETSSNFYIFKIKKIEKYSLEELKKREKQEYILMKKNEIYSEQVKIWSTSISVEKNDKVINQIDILNG